MMATSPVPALWQAGAAPPAFYEYLLVGAAVIVTGWALYRAVVVTLRPREDDPNHIKRLVLEDEEGKRHE
ncbi:MAG: hypothetical protein ACE5HB_03800 [Terriglobia bacterium]